MLAELAKSEGPERGSWVAIAAKYYQDYGSLELPVFTQVRDDFVAYMSALEMSGRSATWPRLPEAAGFPDRETPAVRSESDHRAASADRAVAGLVGECPASHRHSWRRCGRGTGSPICMRRSRSDLVSLGMGDDVSEESDVQDCILGTAIFGRAAMCGRTHVRLVDNPTAAHLEVVLTGTVNSSNVGYNRGVQIFSRGATGVEAVLPVYLDPVGFARATPRLAATRTV